MHCFQQRSLAFDSAANLCMYAGMQGLSTTIIVLFRSLAILLGGALPLMYQRPAQPFGTK